MSLSAAAIPSAFQSAWVVVPQVQAMRETVYGVKTHYVHAGGGQPVVLLHGGGPGASGVTGWSNCIPALAEHFHVYALDLIGAGYTDKPRIEYSFQTLVNHLAGFIDALNLDQVRLVGNSQGAYVAIKYALDHPARVKQAALISSSTLAGAVGLRVEGKAVALPRFDGTRESLRQFLEVILNDHAKITDELVDKRFAVASLPGHREMLESLRRYRQVLVHDQNERQLYEVSTRLPQLNLPWCIIWGEADRSAPLDSVGDALHAFVPDVPFHVVEGSGHQVQNDKPEECNRLLLAFFGSRQGQPVR